LALCVREEAMTPRQAFVEAMRHLLTKAGRQYVRLACKAFADEECAGTHLDEGWCGDPDLHATCVAALLKEVFGE
jgi:hypothetical protein